MTDTPQAQVTQDSARSILDDAMDNAHAFDPHEVVVPLGAALEALAHRQQSEIALREACESAFCVLDATEYPAVVAKLRAALDGRTEG